MKDGCLESRREDIIQAERMPDIAATADEHNADDLDVPAAEEEAAVMIICRSRNDYGGVRRRKRLPHERPSIKTLQTGQEPGDPEMTTCPTKSIDTSPCILSKQTCVAPEGSSKCRALPGKRPVVGASAPADKNRHNTPEMQATPLELEQDSVRPRKYRRQNQRVAVSSSSVTAQKGLPRPSSDATGSIPEGASLSASMTNKAAVGAGDVAMGTTAGAGTVKCAGRPNRGQVTLVVTQVDSDGAIRLELAPSPGSSTPPASGDCVWILPEESFETGKREGKKRRLDDDAAAEVGGLEAETPPARRSKRVRISLGDIRAM